MVHKVAPHLLGLGAGSNCALQSVAKVNLGHKAKIATRFADVIRIIL
jgi:hypothetical protein